MAGGAQGLTVALDTTLTDALRAEGLAREIINKVQNLRKKSGLEVSDRIDLAVSGSATGAGGGAGPRREDRGRNPRHGRCRRGGFAL